MYNWLLSVLEITNVDDVNIYVLLGAIVLTIAIVLVITNLFLSVFSSIFRRY